jgi:ribosomal protein S18 acetylase RimI-like enzyme
MTQQILAPLEHAQYEIVIFNQSNPPSAQDLAKLHLAVLPNSPISLLGEQFARSFYYKLLPKQGLIFGAVAYMNQQPVGFIAATHSPNGFMQQGLKRYFLNLVGIVALSVLTNPIQRLPAIWEAWQIMQSLPEMEIAECEGELLSFGVLPEYRFSTFGRRSGYHIAADLLNTIVKPMQEHGISSVRAIVDADNGPARSFYRKTGWQLRQRPTLGWRVPSIELVWHLL